MSRSNQQTELEQAGSERHLLEIKSQFPVHWHLDHTGILTTVKLKGGLHEIIWFNWFILLRWELRPREQRGPPEVPGLAGAGQTLEPCFSTSRQMHTAQAGSPILSTLLGSTPPSQLENELGKCKGYPGKDRTRKGLLPPK